MSLKHTPGPWIDGNTSDSIINPEMDMDDVFYGGFVICESVTPENKRLIKASPEMLEALIDIYIKGFELRSDIISFKVKKIIESATGLTIEEVLNVTD